MSEKQLSILFPITGQSSRATVVNISVFSAHYLGDHVDNNSLKELVDSFFTTTENTRRSSFPTKPPPNLDPKSPQHRSYNRGAPRGHERRLGRHIGDQCPRPLPHTILTYTLMSPCTYYHNGTMHRLPKPLLLEPEPEESLPLSPVRSCWPRDTQGHVPEEDTW